MARSRAARTCIAGLACLGLALVDEASKIDGSHPDRVHNSASVVKVLFMVTLLRQPTWA
jgi:hypothetical protein